MSSSPPRGSDGPLGLERPVMFISLQHLDKSVRVGKKRGHDLVAQLVLECLGIDLPVREQAEKSIRSRFFLCCPGFFPGACRNLDRGMIFYQCRHRVVLFTTFRVGYEIDFFLRNILRPGPSRFLLHICCDHEIEDLMVFSSHSSCGSYRELEHRARGATVRRAEVPGVPRFLLAVRIRTVWTPGERG